VIPKLVQKFSKNSSLEEFKVIRSIEEKRQDEA
jgi:hypothetical protein